MSQRDKRRRTKERRRARAATQVRRQSLSAFCRSLDREAGVLAKRPDLLWTQLYNRLQWGEEPIRDALEPQLRRRTARGAGPWLRSRTPHRESGTLLRTLIGHQGSVNACAYSPDGRTIVSAGGRDLMLWDAESGRDLASVESHEGIALACAFDPRGRRIVAAGTDKDFQRTTLKLWNAELEEAIATLDGHSARVTACAFSPDGSRIVTSSQDGTLKLWDPETGREVATLEGHTAEVETCAFSPDGAHIVSAGRDGRLMLWDAETGEEVATLEEPFQLYGLITSRTLRPRRFTACAFSPDGRRILACGGLKLQVLDAETGEEIESLPADYWVSACAYSADGAWIGASHDDVVSIWDAKTRGEIATFEGHTASVNDFAFSPDGARLVSASEDGSLKIWEARAGQDAVPTRPLHTHKVTACAHSPDGLWIATAASDLHEPVTLWDADTGEMIVTLRGHSHVVSSCAFRPDGARIVTASHDGTLKIWDLETGTELVTLREHDDGVLACGYSPDGARIVSGGADGRLGIWDAETGKRSATIKAHDTYVTSCAFSPDGSRILSCASSVIEMWDAGTGKPISRIEDDSPVTALAISPDGSRIVSAGWRGTLRLWDAETSQEIATLASGPYGPRTEFTACVFSPDGRSVVAAGDNRVLVVRDAETGEEVAAIVLPGSLHGLAHHPHATRLTVGDSAGNVYRLDLEGARMEPIVVTAIASSDQTMIRCPACWRSFPAEEGVPGQEIRCPASACALPMKVNPFLVVTGQGQEPRGLFRRLTGRFTR